MTETDWLTGEDPCGMLLHLKQTRRIHRTPSGKRRLRLFICACFRRLWDFLPDPRTRAVVELAERLADGKVDTETINAVAEASKAAHWDAVKEALTQENQNSPADRSRAHLADLVRFALEPHPWRAAEATVSTISRLGHDHYAIILLGGNAIRAHLVRELFGNPFSPVVPDAAWLEWSGGIVWKMARTIYNDYRFEDLPILADALEDAGCMESDLLAHCRSGGIHARGCWAVDLLLGKG